MSYVKKMDICPRLIETTKNKYNSIYLYFIPEILFDLASKATFKLVSNVVEFRNSFENVYVVTAHM